MKFRTVTVYDSEQTKEEIPTNLTEHIAWLQSKLEQIPEEHRATARADIFASESCGVPVLCYSIKYDLPTATTITLELGQYFPLTDVDTKFKTPCK